MNLTKFACVVTALAACCSAAVAHAHARWDPAGLLKPRPYSDGRYPDDLKSGPCGNLPRTSTPVALVAGSTITVQFEATIFHQGAFRIAFSPANDQGFDNNILVDNIPDSQGQRYRSYEITLPDTPCDQCTLQLIQTMLDRNPPSNYFSCTDIQLTAPDIAQPQSPTGFSAMQQGDEIVLNWGHSEDAVVMVVESEAATVSGPQSGQQFQLDDSLGQAKVVYLGSSTELTLPGRAASKPYYYWAYAVDSQLQYSDPVKTQITLTEVEPATKGGASSYWLLMLLTFPLLLWRKATA